MHESAMDRPISLHELRKDTAKYFLKAPVANMIEFTISCKVILLEGPSEYMLFQKFYQSVTGHNPEIDDVHIIDVRGLSFIRYLEIARLLGSKVAVVTDNDGNIQRNCKKKYADFKNDKNIRVFYEADECKSTFEKVLYDCNEDLCDQVFGIEALNYMLKNKTEAAYKLLIENQGITVPTYIQGAIEWIKE